MKKKYINRIKVKDEIVCAPKQYRGIPDVSDDYDVSAAINNIESDFLALKVIEFINCEEDYVYGPSTSYKGKYSYNRDD